MHQTSPVLVGAGTPALSVRRSRERHRGESTTGWQYSRSRTRPTQQIRQTKPKVKPEDKRGLDCDPAEIRTGRKPDTRLMSVRDPWESP
ncbi:hypothetical protein EYF80_065447 [Liparis tanakae]|uniref:Uncharacterized protein n=1 Tax=Liparis tanakae TaxID=230148 RepID=A0A4Z2E6K2_9TELE|nr:hypothetical protein EYF80_065447 [Liparis tanakae]